MSEFIALAGSVPCNERRLSARRLVLAIITFSLIALPAAQAIAYPGGGTLPSVGSLDEYVRQTQPPDRGYAPPGQYMGQAGGLYGGPAASRSQMNPAVMGTMMIALWALQRYQQRHQRHTARHYRRHYHSAGNPMQSPF